MNILTTAYCEHYRLKNEFMSVETLRLMKSHGFRQVTSEDEEEAFKNENELRETITKKYGKDILEKIEEINDFILSIEYDSTETISEWYNKAIFKVKEKFPLFEEEKIKNIIGIIAYNYSR